MTMPSEVRY